MKTQKIRLNIVLACALLLVLCAAPARAGVSLLYYVGYGLYPNSALDTTATAPGTGLLANNGSGRALVQLIYAGPDYQINPIDPDNSLAGYVSGDDAVWQSTVIEMGINDTDEWGFSNIPLVYADPAWSTPGFVFVRVFQSDTPRLAEYFYVTPLLALDTSLLADGIFSQPFVIDHGPTTGVALGNSSGSTKIQSIVLDPETAGLVFAVPHGHSLKTVYGADSVLPSGDWNWEPLVEGTHYSDENNVVTLLTAGEGVAPLKMIRIGLLHDF